MADKFKIDPASVVTAANNTSLPTEAVLDIMQRDGIKLEYGALALLVRKQDYAVIQRQVAARTPEQRSTVMVSVDRALRSAVPAVTAGTASKKVYDDFYADLMLWNALKAMAI